MDAGLIAPGQLASRRLFEPIAPALVAFGAALPEVAALDAWLAGGGRPVSGGGAPIRLVTDGPSLPYEARIYTRGEVATRPGSWHDFYNALTWITFPHIKAALNARHMAHLDAAGPRGPVRDAATQFDECGVVVLSDVPTLPALLRDHAWREAFWTQRAALIAHCRFLVVGHAIYERLHAAFSGLCGKAVYVDAPAAVINAPVVDQCAFADRVVAALLAGSGVFDRPAALSPLPLLGIPGVVPESETAAYYDDARHFRPKPQTGSPKRLAGPDD